MTGTTTGASDDIDESAEVACWLSDDAAEHVYQFTLSEGMALQIDTEGSAYDTKLAIVSPCATGAELCLFNDDFDLEGEDLFSHLPCTTFEGGTTYSLIVTGYGGRTGDYQLNIDQCAICGNGVLEAGEDCESGPCCDDCEFRPLSYMCQNNVEADYSCPWGTSCGADVGVRYRDQYCSGSSASCDGSYGSWESWAVADACTVEEVCDDGDSTCNDSRPCHDDYCTSGSCCNTGTQTMRPSSYVCQNNAEADYGCPWGTGCGADVGVRYRDQYCSGSSDSCDGAFGSWESWETADICTEDEVCADSDSSCKFDDRCIEPDLEPSDDLDAGTIDLGPDVVDAAQDGDVVDLSADSPVDAEAGEGTCDDPIRIDPTDETLTGDLTDVADNLEGSCGGSGGDRVFEFTVSTEVVFSAEASGFDTILYIRTACNDEDSELACNDDNAPPGGSGSRVDASLDPGTYYLVLDSNDEEAGFYSLRVSFESLGTPDAETSDAGDDSDDSTQEPSLSDLDDIPGAENPSITLGAGTEGGSSGCGCTVQAATQRGLSTPWFLIGLLLTVPVLRRRRPDLGDARDRARKCQ